MSDINDLNAGETKGGSVQLDPQAVLRLKQYRIDHLKAHPGTPLTDVAQIVGTLLTHSLSEYSFAGTEGGK